MKDLSTGLSELMDYATKNQIMYTLEATLGKFTTFRIGGKCRCLVFVNSAQSCLEMISICRRNDVPYFVLGKGSNVLISDNGYNGVAFVFGKDFAAAKAEDDIIVCQSGCPLARASYIAYSNSLTGFEFAWGIPGSVGGAVVMNAGAYGGEIKDIIVSAEYIDCSEEKIKTAFAQGLDLSYRHSMFSSDKYIVTSASFKLNKGDRNEIRSRMDELMEKRKTKQPLEYPSAGSTFKRPEGTFASYLIEQCGLKGYSVGGAEVSSKHSGFVINKNNASYSDVITLIEDVRRIVKEQSGYELECEVKIISDSE